jgi:lipid-A-disaccharide synthase
MGVFEVLPSLPRILKRMKQTVNAARDLAPDAIVTIDSPDFCFRIIKKLKAKGNKTPCIHYVAPSVWAWRPGRAKKVAGFLDHLLTLMPFEPPYFTAHGLGSTFVGHPVVEKLQERGDGARFRRAHGLKPAQPILCLLPGSRMSEIERLLPVFGEVADEVLQKRPATAIVIPTLPHLKKHIEAFFTGKGINPLVIDGTAEKMDCFSASTAALAASGTVTLELALCDTPHVIAYKLSPLSALIPRPHRAVWWDRAADRSRRPAAAAATRRQDPLRAGDAPRRGPGSRHDAPAQPPAAGPWRAHGLSSAREPRARPRRLPPGRSPPGQPAGDPGDDAAA